MIIGTMTTKAVSIAAVKLINELYVDDNDMYKAMLTVDTLNMSTEYNLFKNTLSSKGYDLDNVCCVRLFQVVVDLLVISLGDTPEMDSVLDEILKELFYAELTDPDHDEYFHELLYDKEGVTVALHNIYEMFRDMDGYYVHRSQGHMYLPLRWYYTNNNVFLTVGGYCDT